MHTPPSSYTLDWLINSWCPCCVSISFLAVQSPCLPWYFSMWSRGRWLNRAWGATLHWLYNWTCSHFSPHIHITLPPFSFHRARLNHSPRESTMSTAPSRAMSQNLTTLRVWRLRRRSIRSDGCLSRTPHTSSSPPMVRDPTKIVTCWRS